MSTICYTRNSPHTDACTKTDTGKNHKFTYMLTSLYHFFLYNNKNTQFEPGTNLSFKFGCNWLWLSSWASTRRFCAVENFIHVIRHLWMHMKRIKTSSGSQNNRSPLRKQRHWLTVIALICHLWFTVVWLLFRCSVSILKKAVKSKFRSVSSASLNEQTVKLATKMAVRPKILLCSSVKLNLQTKWNPRKPCHSSL